MRQISADRFRRIIKEYLLFPTFEESVYIAILTAFFLFLSFIAHARTERGAIAGFVVVYYGFPLEWFRINANFGSWYSSLTTTEILWLGFVGDVILFVLLSLFLVRFFETIADRIPTDLFQRW